MTRSYVISILKKYKTSLAMTALPHRDFMIWSRRKDDFEQCLRKYVQFWIRKLSSCDCDDPFLTAVVINLYNAFQENALAYCLLPSPTGADPDWSLFYSGPRPLRLVTMKDEIANQLLLDRDLTDVREGVNYGLMNIGRVIQSEERNFLKVLILYGIIRPKETLTQSVGVTHTSFLHRFLEEIALMFQEYRISMRYNDHFVNLSSRLKRKTFGSVDPDEKAKILRKCNLLKLLVCPYYIWGTNQATTVLKYINYYFQVIPDPFVTAKEIEDAIEIPETWQSMFDRNRLRCFMIEYSRIFSESGVLQPRSLQHLSRCAAREHLCKYGLLPKVVSRLMIPKAFKEYLLVVNPES